MSNISWPNLPPDPFLTYPHASDYIEAAFEAKDQTGSVEISEQKRQEMIDTFGLEPRQAQVLEYFASGRAQTMLDDLDLDCVRFCLGQIP